eukprot:m.6503 g.6503  ORF g.6503 m.6503 type:complete len:343 (-) comp2626_c0_seq1:24-1052(-)
MSDPGDCADIDELRLQVEQLKQELKCKEELLECACEEIAGLAAVEQFDIECLKKHYRTKTGESDDDDDEDGASSESSSFRVATLNCNGLDERWVNSEGRYFQTFARLIERYQIDMVALQEINCGSKTPNCYALRLAKQLNCYIDDKGEWKSAEGHIGRGHQMAESSAILYKSSIFRRSHVSAAPAPGRGALFARFSVYDVPKRAKTFEVIVVHTVSANLSASFNNIRSVTARYRSCDVICGDFNIDPYKAARRVSPKRKKLPRFSHAVENPESYLKPTENTRIKDFFLWRRHSRWDLSDPEVVPRYDMLLRAGRDALPSRELLSDHAMVYVDLTPKKFNFSA